MPSASTMMKPIRYASGALPPALPTIVVVKRKAAIAGAMCVTFCMIAPVRLTAPGVSSVCATQTSPGGSTKSTSSDLLVSIWFLPAVERAQARTCVQLLVTHFS